MSRINEEADLRNKHQNRQGIRYEQLFQPSALENHPQQTEWGNNSKPRPGKPQEGQAAPQKGIIEIVTYLVVVQTEKRLFQHNL